MKTGDLLFRIDPRGVPLFAQAVPAAVPAGLPSALLERRPDVKKLEEQLVAANAQIGVAKAEFLPELSLTGMLGKASPELSYLEVLNAEERLFPAQNARAAARLSRLLAYVQLYKTLGGGWNATDTPDAQAMAEPAATSR